MKSILKLSLLSLLLHALAAPAAITVTNIAQGSSAYHSLFLKSDGSLWVMGINDYGQLGDGTVTSFPRGIYHPEEIVAGGVIAIASGGDHSLFLKSDGSLWGMGENSAGQLGDGTLNNANKPEEIVTNGVTAIAAGGGHSLFLKSDGSLWAMGENGDGQLGDGTYSTDYPYGTNQPEQIVANGVIAIAAGGQHSLFLKSDGSLWAMGNNAVGQLGDRTFNNTNQPEQIVAGGVMAISAGANHSLFLKSDGSLWVMGGNFYGQLGDGTYSISPPYGTNQPEQIVANSVTTISAGQAHSLFIKSDGSLWGMGMNGWGQLGADDTNQPEKIISDGIVAIAAEAIHSLLLKSDGSLWAMGDNEFGQLGDGFIDEFAIGSPEQTFPSPQPVLAQTISNTDLQFTSTCLFGGNFNLLVSTNLAQPLSQWSPVWTNIITSRSNNIFSATLTNAVNSSSRQFYILQSQ